MNIPHKWKKFDIRKYVSEQKFISNITPSNDTVWITIEEELFDNNFSRSETYGFLKFVDNQWVLFSSQKIGFLKNQVVLQTGCDSDGNLWLFVPQNEILVFNGQVQKNFLAGQDGLPTDISPLASTSSFCSPFISDDNNQMWISMGFLGCFYYDGLGWHSFNFSGYSRDDGWVKRIAKGKNGVLWFLIQYESVSHIVKYDGSQCELYSILPVGINAEISGFEINSKGNIFISFLFEPVGLWVWKPDRKDWHSYNVNNSQLLNDRIEALSLDHYEQLWIGTSSELTLFYNNNFKSWNFLASNGLKLIEPRLEKDSPHYEWQRQNVLEVAKIDDPNGWALWPSQLAIKNDVIWISTDKGLASLFI